MLVPLLQHAGKWYAARAPMPAHFVHTLSGLLVMYTPEVSTLPTQLRTRSTLNIWLPDHGGKVFSAEWEPLVDARGFRQGDWLAAISDLSPSRRLQ